MPLHVEQMLRMRKSWSFGCSIASRPGGDEQRWKRGYASHGEPRFIPPQHSLQTTKALIWFARLVGGEIDSIVFFVFKAAPLHPGRIWPLAMGTHLWIGCTATQCSFGQNSGLCRTNCSFCRKFCHLIRQSSQQAVYTNLYFSLFFGRNLYQKWKLFSAMGGSVQKNSLFLVRVYGVCTPCSDLHSWDPDACSLATLHRILLLIAWYLVECGNRRATVSYHWNCRNS